MKNVIPTNRIDDEDIKILGLGDRVRIMITPDMQKYLGEYKYLEFTLDSLGYNMQDEYIWIKMKDGFVALDLKSK